MSPERGEEKETYGSWSRLEQEDGLLKPFLARLEVGHSAAAADDAIGPAAP